MKIGITNAVLSNTGDAAILQGIIESITRDVDGRAQIVVFDSNARVTAEIYPDYNIVQQLTQVIRRHSRMRFLAAQATRITCLWIVSYLPRLLRALARIRRISNHSIGRSLYELDECDVVISSGGTYLVDHYDFTHRMVELRCAKALGSPVVLWTQSLGPFRTWRSRWLARRIAHIVDAVYCRDTRSAEEWRRVTGYAGPLDVVPDAAFTLQAPVNDLRDRDAVRRRAVISVREWSRGVDGEVLDRQRYEFMMRASVEALHNRGWSLLAISTCQGLASYSYDDGVVAREMFKGQDIQIDDRFHTPSELLQVLTECRLVVTTRMHLAILALLSRVPVIAIAYEFKTLELFRSLGLSHAVIRIEDSSPDWIRRAIHLAIDDPERFRLSPDRRDHLRASAALPVEVVKQLTGVPKARPGEHVQGRGD